MQTILVVEDDHDLNQSIGYSLKKSGYAVCGVTSIEKAKQMFNRNQIDLILFDVNLPDGEGFSFCRWVKAKREVPVMYLTARDMEEDALAGYISIYVSKGSLIPMLCVVFSDVMVAVIWGLLKYSDIHFWKNLGNDNEWFSSRKYGSECRSIAVNINKDGISHKQKVYIENLLAERIDNIEGVIKFFSGNTERNHIAFKTIDIDSGREVKIDEIAYDTDREYGDKTYWDEVELHIDNIVSKDSRACVWSSLVLLSQLVLWIHIRTLSLLLFMLLFQLSLLIIVLNNFPLIKLLSIPDPTNKT